MERLSYQMCKQMEFGTHGRRWYTSQKGNIAFSIVIYPCVSVEKLAGLTIEIAQIIVSVFKNLYHINLEIKAPNDLVIATKKIGGILTETILQGEVVKSLVIGIGINTNKTFFEEEIKDIATSIKNEFDIQVDNEAVIEEFCNQFEKNILKRLGRVL